MRCDRLLPLAALALALSACAGSRDRAIEASAGPALVAQSFGSVRPSRAETLILVLHDDLASGVPAEHVAFAQAAAARFPDARVEALFRPGYADAAGRTSPGTRDRAIGDGYGRAVIEMLADTVRGYRARFPRARLVLVGHGGGAALAANLAGTQPALVDAMLLVGCPCSLPEWRALRAKRNPAFREPVTSLDPLQTVGGVSPSLHAAMVVGDEDRVTPPEVSRSYAEALALRGIAVDYRRLPGKGHDILTDPETIQALAELLEPVERTAASR